jgi:hypothetical protein
MIAESHLAMTLIEAQQNASQILDAERTAPTTTYKSPAPFVNQAAIAVSALGQRGWHPRPVSETPGYYFLQSRNYELLKSFFEDVAQSERPLFLAQLRQRISDPNPFKVVGQDVLGAGKTDRTNSELPLVAEFLVRQGDAGGLLRALQDVPLRPALTRLLLHVEEMIALDYRLFSDEEYDELGRLVSNTKGKLEELKRQHRLSDTRESNYRHHVCAEGATLCNSIAEQCRKAKYLRLATRIGIRTSGRLEGIDSLEPNQDNENFDMLARQVRAAIENGTPELGLDRLHTFVLKYIRTIYGRHFGRSPNRTATANSLLGEFANDLRRKGVIQSKMTSEILKSSARVFDDFNDLRNNQTLAHDNPELINKEEAHFIYQSVAASVRFLRSFEENKKTTP